MTGVRIRMTDTSANRLEYERSRKLVPRAVVQNLVYWLKDLVYMFGLLLV